MIGHADDTIVALSTAQGPGERAVVRLAGPDSLRIARGCFQSDAVVSPDERHNHHGSISISGLLAPMPASLWVFPAGRSYTGDLLVEIHTISSPPLIDRLIADLLQLGARPALGGEFTQRAFLSGKLDLTRAEAVLAVIEANDDVELRSALAQLAGGVSRPLERLRSDLLDLLADLEAGLDFAEEDLQFIQQDDLLKRLTAALAQVSLVQKQIVERSQSNRPFRVVLTGKPNAGKSRLFNAMTGAQALVSNVPGTTRDYLAHSFLIDDQRIELIDTAGWQSSSNMIDEQAQQLGRSQSQRADLVIECVPVDDDLPETKSLIVRTKSDLRPRDSSGQHLRVSAKSGEGLDELQQLLADRSRSRRTPPLAPSLSRCENHVARCLEHLRKAHQMVLFGDPPELLAIEFRETLEQLGEMVGAVYTDDLLDRIFSRFCIGK